MRKLLFNLHLWVALIAGLFIVILGLTGSIMAFEQEIDQVAHWKLNYITPQPQARSLHDLAGIVTAAYPGEPIRGYGLSTSPGMSYQIATRKRMVYLNQYTGEILGATTGGDALSSFLGSVHQLHLRLLIRNRADTGRYIESGAGLAAIFLALSGLYLWWPVKRMRLAASWTDLHHTVGILSFVFLLILATTGVVIGFEDSTTPLFFRVTGSTPAPRIPRNSEPHPPDSRPIAPDEVVAIARTAVPGAAPFAIDVPGPNGTYFIRSRFPEDRTPGGRSLIVVDQFTGKVLWSQSSRTAPGGTRMVIQNRAIHTGDLFGIPTKILMSLASLAAAAQFVTGLVMWWRRRIY